MHFNSQLKASGIDASSWQTKSAPGSPTKSRALPTVPDTNDVNAETGSSGLFFVIFLVLAAIILQIYHGKITAPIAPGQVLAPGGWVSKCGLLAPLPSCDNAYLKMGEDGVLSLHSAEGELEWKMEGAVCANGDDACVDGLEMADDLYLRIGGKKVSWVNVRKDADPLSPWPFSEQPQLKIIHARK